MAAYDDPLEGIDVDDADLIEEDTIEDEEISHLSSDIDCWGEEEYSSDYAYLNSLIR